MLRTIATTQKLSHLRSAQVHMSDHDPAPVSYTLRLGAIFDDVSRARVQKPKPGQVTIYLRQA